MAVDECRLPKKTQLALDYTASKPDVLVAFPARLSVESPDSMIVG